MEINDSLAFSLGAGHEIEPVSQSEFLLDPQPDVALERIKSPEGDAIYASGDALYNGAFFGRDSLEVIDDLLDKEPELCAKLLIKNASLQGFCFDRKREEEPGRIAHEHRVAPTDDDDEAYKLIFAELSERWGSYNGDLTYFGSVDATPKFVQMLCAYANRYGNGILDVRVERRNGEVVTMNEALGSAVGWLQSKLRTSSSGLLEFKTVNPAGIENQVWKDSREFYVHEDGTLANHARPVASIEVQGLVYDALMDASELRPDMALQLKQEATNIRDRTLDLLWLEDRNYFALGLDHDPSTDNIRQIKTTTANPASLLETRFFDNLPDQEREKYISAIANKIMGSDFLTDAGIRSRALSAQGVSEYWDYHGSHVAWPMETKRIAKGLRRQGFSRLAQQLYGRLLNGVTRYGSYTEFIYVDDDGRMLTDILYARTHESMMVVESTNKPESLQAWTITAVIHALSDLYGNKFPKYPRQTLWQFNLEWAILGKMPIIGHIKRRDDLDQLYPEQKAVLSVPKSVNHTNFYNEDVRKAMAV